MYFTKFPTILYEFPSIGDDKTSRNILIKDITRNIRFKKEFIEQLPTIDTYKILDGDTPESISEKLYGTPQYHWILMLLNQRYDYINDFPLSSRELDAMITTKYGSARDLVHHFAYKNGNITNGYCTAKLIKVVKGSVLVTETSDIVQGVGTAFKDQLVAGSILYTRDDILIGTVKTVQNGTQLVLQDVSLYNYIGDFKCVIPVKEGLIIRAKTAIGYSAGRIEEDLGNGNWRIMLTSSSFVPGQLVQVYEYGDDADGNYMETYYGYMSITSISYPDVLRHVSNADYEYELNEKIRTIKVLPANYLEQVISEFGNILE